MARGVAMARGAAALTARAASTMAQVVAVATVDRAEAAMAQVWVVLVATTPTTTRSCSHWLGSALDLQARRFDGTPAVAGHA